MVTQIISQVLIRKEHAHRNWDPFIARIKLGMHLAILQQQGTQRALVSKSTCIFTSLVRSRSQKSLFLYYMGGPHSQPCD